MAMTAGLFLLVLAAVFFFRKGTASNDIFQKFGLSPGAFKLLSSDLGDAAPRMRLHACGVNGEPDAQFMANASGKVVVGEYKSRKYKGFVRPYEFYQTILYMGLAQQTHRVQEVSGVIAYADGRVQVHFDQAVFAALVELRFEMLSSFKQRRPVNPKPLHKRMNVLGINRHIRFG